MTKNPQSKDDSLEALDFIVNVLKEHERDLDKLINELATVTEQLGDTGEISNKVEKVEEKINNLQKEVTNLITYMSNGTPSTLKRNTSNGSQRTTKSCPSSSFKPNRSRTGGSGKAFGDFAVHAVGRFSNFSFSRSNVVFLL